LTGTTPVNCSAKKATATNGACGSAAGVTTTTKPTSNLCSPGTVGWSDANGSDGSFNWNCAGTNGGTTAYCAAPSSEGGTTTGGTCGSANGEIYTSKPTTGLCAAGTSSWVDGTGSDGTYNWRCSGTVNSTNCAALHQTTNSTVGICGSSNEGTYTSAPSGGLCTAGTSTWVDSTGSDGTYNWRCVGSSTTVSCYAKKMSGTADCSKNNGFCTYDITGCTASHGTPHDGWGCSGGETCCTGVTKGKTYYYYNSSTKTCLSTSVYASASDCLKAKGVACFSSLSSCDSAHSCQSISGSCRTVCGADELINGNGSGECSPAKCCVLKAGSTKKNGECGSVLGSAYHPSDSYACKVGTVYWTDIEGKDGTLWYAARVS
jgi:hypothetical protein